MKVDPFPKKYQRKRTARKRRTQFCSQVSSSYSGIHGNLKGFAGTESHDQDNGGYNIEMHHLPVTVNLLLYERTKYVLVAEERTLLNTSSQFSCFPRGPRSKAKVARKRTTMISHMAVETMTGALSFFMDHYWQAFTRVIHELLPHLGGKGEGFSAEGISKECPTSSTAHPRARRKGRKRKTKPKDEWSDSEVTVPRRIHFRGQARRRRNSSNTITSERGKLDSATFLHYFTHIWSAFPEEKVKSVTYFDPLWFDLYANESNREMVLNWIKEKGIFSKKYVLVPIVMWSHWSLLIFCHLGESVPSKTNTPCMLLLDSLHAIGPTRLEPLIRRLLFDIRKSEERLESKEQLKKMPLLIPKVPQQKKGEECGFYVLYFIKLFLESAPENFGISQGYPYFMKKDWFTVEEVESFCISLDAFPVVLSDHDDSATLDSSDSVELIKTSFFGEEA